MDFDVLELWKERVHVAMAANHPMSCKSILDWPDRNGECFMVSEMQLGPEVRDYIVRRIADYSTYPDISYRRVTQETLLHMVALGEGITLVSEGSVLISTQK